MSNRAVGRLWEFWNKRMNSSWGKASMDRSANLRGTVLLCRVWTRRNVNFAWCNNLLFISSTQFHYLFFFFIICDGESWSRSNSSSIHTSIQWGVCIQESFYVAFHFWLVFKFFYNWRVKNYPQDDLRIPVVYGSHGSVNKKKSMTFSNDGATSSQTKQKVFFCS